MTLIAQEITALLRVSKQILSELANPASVLMSSSLPLAESRSQLWRGRDIRNRRWGVVRVAPQVANELHVGDPISVAASLFVFCYGSILNDPTNPA
jgi:hypothetical protein